MAGFYIHIPFCRKVCYYCDFHFVATLKYKDAMIDALIREIESKAADWEGVEFKTLYFGGGTPSVLSVDEISRISDTVFKHYQFNNEIEYTLEANPDDLTSEYLRQLKKQTSINRLSIGTQSFHDADLKIMNRRHNGTEAITSIKTAQDTGFLNLNIDLIYGVPGLSNEGWRSNINQFLKLEAPHLSAYHLTFEPKTVFDHMRKKDKLQPVNDSISQEHYGLLIQQLKESGFTHYEISNFAREGHFSKHNNSYWLGDKYIGIGPSAHSFNGNSRIWNVSNNTKYTKSLLESNSDYFTVENLSITDRFNEYILTSLRTQWGVDVQHISDEFGKIYADYFTAKINAFNEGEQYIKTAKGYKLTEEAWLISDYIIRELFYDK